MDTVSKEHRAAMSAGRKESEAIKKYITYLHEGGTQTSRRNIGRQIETAERNLASAKEAGDLIKQVKCDAHVRALRHNYVKAPKVHVSIMEQAFVDNAAGYSAKHGITRATWREFGVPVKS